MIGIGQKLPSFNLKATVNIGHPDKAFANISDTDYAGKWKILFFWPKDFTFVCPSEILAYSNRVPQFEDRKVKVVAVSVDSPYSHYAWRNTSPKNGGLGPVKFPLVSDLTKSIARDYDVLIEDQGVALRGTFLLDRDGIVRHQLVNDLPLFIDPFLLFNSDRSEYQDLHAQIIAYLMFLRDKARSGSVNDALLTIALVGSADGTSNATTPRRT